MIVVSDTTPLISLLKIKRVDLLKELLDVYKRQDIENVSFVGFVDAEMQVFRTALEETDENDAEKESDS